jgi:hypothetical protein
VMKIIVELSNWISVRFRLYSRYTGICWSLYFRTVKKPIIAFGWLPSDSPSKPLSPDWLRSCFTSCCTLRNLAGAGRRRFPPAEDVCIHHQHRCICGPFYTDGRARVFCPSSTTSTWEQNHCHLLLIDSTTTYLTHIF